MNAIRDTPFTRALENIGRDFPAPAAVCCVSAHWLTRATFVTGMAQPRTIHDFGGFAQALFDIAYPAPGDPALAARLAGAHADIAVDLDWGLDQGAWAVLRKIYPHAAVPVIQLSIDATKSGAVHADFGRRLAALREDGVMILGSGNIAHNLRRVDFSDDDAPLDWAVAFDLRAGDLRAGERIAARDIGALADPFARADIEDAARLAIPTTEHWLPLLYVLGAAQPDDILRVRYEAIDNASISMRTFSFEAA
jgi:4,5-DOPA dioxygenase extradiol